MDRYSRQIILPEVGERGQEKLANARVLVVGAGGLGCPVLLYLAGAGIGAIGIVDGDSVEESNLHRQVLFTPQDIGQNKAQVAARKLSTFNPTIKIRAFAERISNTNGLSIAQDYDLIIDGSDNFPTRYLVNDIAVILDKPLVFGSIFKFEGQISVFNFRNGPSYRCLFPEPSAPGQVPSCSEIGVLGVLPGVIGTMMASECLKLILGFGEVLSGKLKILNLKTCEERTLKINRVEENFEISSLDQDYEYFCGINKENEMQQILPTELKARLDAGEELLLIDVREGFENEICSIAGSQNIPLGDIPAKAQELDEEKTTVMICHHGMRSAQAIGFLMGKGYKNLINLRGGIHAWAIQVDNGMARY